MAKYYTPMDSFKDVEELYEGSKPVRKRDPDHRTLNIYMDLRPTNDRNRQLECVRKLSDNKYALCDYDTFWTLSRGITYDPHKCRDLKAFNAFVEAHAAIVWERKRNGDEVLTIRNLFKHGRYDPLPIGRNDFLERHLPRYWYMSSDKGNQYLRNPLGLFVLPKNTFLPKMMRVCTSDDAKDLAVFKDRTQSTQTKQDMTLVFVRKGGEWARPKVEYRPLGWRVNKERKSKIYPVIRPFIDHSMPMVHMLVGCVAYSDDDVRALVTYLDKQIDDTLGPAKFPTSCRWALNRGRLVATRHDTLQKCLLDIMRSTEHPHAYGLVKMLATRIQESGSANPDRRGVVNTWINRFFDLIEKREV